MKWHSRVVVNPNPVQNMNPNPNPNIQMIYVKLRQPNILPVTKRGAAMVADQSTQQGKQQVRPSTENKALLDVQQEKEVFWEV